MCFGLRVRVLNLIIAGMSAPHNLQHYCHFLNVYFSEMQSVFFLTVFWTSLSRDNFVSLVERLFHFQFH